jgi:hypothetical protein
MNNRIEKKNVRSYWGPRLWYIIHKITYNLPLIISLNEQNLLSYYFNLIGSIIPCPYCAAHYKSSVYNKLLIRNLSSRKLIIDWFNTQHNDINVLKRTRIYQTFELDLLYNNSSFNHDYFKELVIYLYERIIYGEITYKSFIHWLIITYKLFPCILCNSLAKNYFLNNDIERLGIVPNNSIILQWINGLFETIKHT